MGTSGAKTKLLMKIFSLVDVFEPDDECRTRAVSDGKELGGDLLRSKSTFELISESSSSNLASSNKAPGDMLWQPSSFIIEPVSPALPNEPSSEVCSSFAVRI